jgi:hypothetical protein
MMKITIFYSWQSDLPNNTNRGFIESVISKAINDIKRQETYELDICLERDTQGTPGSPNIVKTILDRVSKCDIFIADISIVTGDLTKMQRLSPNPNVLIELGYAISRVGWDRIILFCNEIYGTNEKLPFDIQQHRRIGYKLKSDDIKAPIRDQLAKILKDGLIEITENLYDFSNKKFPAFSVAWTYFNYVPSENTRNGIEKEQITTEVLTLPKSRPIDDVVSNLEREIEAVKTIDGSIDPEWENKVARFVDNCTDFIKKLNSKIAKRNFLIDQNSNHAVLATLTLDNIGSLPASDVRVKIKLPDCILAFEDLPDKDEIPVRPKMPNPSPPVPLTHKFPFKNTFGRPYDLHIPNLACMNRNQTSACYVKNGTLTLWADKLLHKHELTITDDCFYLLALPNSEVGNHILTAEIFCVEYDDWRKADLSIEIIEPSNGQ